jgi:hypothetical protein
MSVITITNEQREERFKTAPEHIRKLYDSNGLFLWQVFTAYQLPSNRYRDFSILVSNIVLGFIPRADFTPMLMLQFTLEHSKAEKIDRSMEQYFKQIETGVLIEEKELPPIIPGADNETRDALVLKPRMTEKITERKVPEPGSKPLTREELLHSLAAKRTLASDISALTGENPDGTTT